MPTQNSKVAVLLAAYNGMSWIQDQIASIHAQVDVDVHVFISVDHSTDGTFEWCCHYAALHPSVTVLSVGCSGGASQNFFRLIREIDFKPFDFISFADQDDLWHPSKLRNAVQVLRRGGIQAYSSNVTAFWQDGRERLIDKAQAQVRWDYLFEAAGPGCTYVLNRELAVHLQKFIVEQKDLLVDVLLHDWCIYAFARSRGYTWYIDEWSSMRYRQHEKNVMGANTGLASLLSRLKKVREGWWFRQIELIARITGSPNDEFEKSCNHLGRLRLLTLAFKARYCRRRARDQLLFVVICLLAPLLVRRRV